MVRRCAGLSRTGVLTTAPLFPSLCADSCVLVHDITDSKSFDNLESWMGQQRNNTGDAVRWMGDSATR